MKKLLVLMVALTMVFGFAALASADVAVDAVQSIEVSASIMPADASMDRWAVLGDMGAVQVAGREAPDTIDMTFMATCEIDIGPKPPLIDASGGRVEFTDNIEIKDDGLVGADCAALVATSTGKGGAGVYASGKPLAV